MKADLLTPGENALKVGGNVAFTPHMAWRTAAQRMRTSSITIKEAPQEKSWRKTEGERERERKERGREREKKECVN